MIIYDFITYETKGVSITVNLLTNSVKSYCDAFNKSFWLLLPIKARNYSVLIHDSNYELFAVV